MLLFGAILAACIVAFVILVFRLDERTREVHYRYIRRP